MASESWDDLFQWLCPGSEAILFQLKGHLSESRFGDLSRKTFTYSVELAYVTQALRISDQVVADTFVPHARELAAQALKVEDEDFATLLAPAARQLALTADRYLVVRAEHLLANEYSSKPDHTVAFVTALHHYIRDITVTAMKDYLIALRRQIVVLRPELWVHIADVELVDPFGPAMRDLATTTLELAEKYKRFAAAYGSVARDLVVAVDYYFDIKNSSGSDRADALASAASGVVAAFVRYVHQFMTTVHILVSSMAFVPDFAGLGSGGLSLSLSSYFLRQDARNDPRLLPFAQNPNKTFAQAVGDVVTVATNYLKARRNVNLHAQPFFLYKDAPSSAVKGIFIGFIATFIPGLLTIMREFATRLPELAAPKMAPPETAAAQESPLPETATETEPPQSSPQQETGVVQSVQPPDRAPEETATTEAEEFDEEDADQPETPTGGADGKKYVWPDMNAAPPATHNGYSPFHNVLWRIAWALGNHGIIHGHTESELKGELKSGTVWGRGKGQTHDIFVSNETALKVVEAARRELAEIVERGCFHHAVHTLRNHYNTYKNKSLIADSRERLAEVLYRVGLLYEDSVDVLKQSIDKNGKLAGKVFGKYVSGKFKLYLSDKAPKDFQTKFFQARELLGLS